MQANEQHLPLGKEVRKLDIKLTTSYENDLRVKKEQAATGFPAPKTTPPCT
jgi:hypothetical protein